MNHDVDDPEKGFQSNQTDWDAGRTVYSRQKSHLLTRIRNFNNLAMSSIGSAFSGPISAVSSYVLQDNTANASYMRYDRDDWDSAGDLEAGRTSGSYSRNQQSQGSYYDNGHTIETSTPTQTRSNSPHQFSKLSDVKRLFNNFARSRHADIDQNDLQLQASRQHTHPPPLYAPSVYSWDDQDQEPSGTPPLTPDSFEDLAAPSPILLTDYDDEVDMTAWNRSRSHSQEIKEGKKPERVDCYDTLIEDDSSGYDPTSMHSIKSDPSVSIISNISAAENGDQDEWFGLEYTLELSCRDRIPSDSKSAGEHSRSRESWAAIHQGSIHPFFEDEEYYQWKNWHRHLDRQDERKKHKRGWDFKARSKDQAWFYADEMKTRDVMYWQKEVYGVIARDVKERLHALAERRPDPYSPPRKHGLGWYLKRSRSVACIRELRALPSLKHNAKAYEDDDAPPEEHFSADGDCSVFLLN